MIGLFSTLFFVFTFTAFYGVTLGINRQIVGELFLLLSVFLLLDKTLSITKRRLLLVTFGAALAVSHYALAYIYLIIIAVVFVSSMLMRPKSENTLNKRTLLLIFVITFFMVRSWINVTTPIISKQYKMVF